MTETNEVVIGDKGGEHVSFYIATARDGEGWFGASVTVQCGGWRGRISTSFFENELDRFVEEIRELHCHLTGKAILNPVEGHIKLTFEGDGKGHITINGEAQQNLAGSTRLTFDFEIDQTYLPQIVNAFTSAIPKPR